MRLVFTAGVILAALTGCAHTTPSNQNIPEQAPVAGTSTEPGRDTAMAGFSAAMQRRDYQQAMAIESDWAKRYPTDLDFRHLEPALYLLTGDVAGWDHSRTDLLNTWRRTRGAMPPPSKASFTIDVIKSDTDLIIADQCYEPAGRFGVLYRFTVISADRQVRSFFTVESPSEENEIARQLGRPSPVFTLDHFKPGMHETVAMLPGLPPYADLKQRMLNYIANPRPVSASGNGQGELSNEECAFTQANKRG